MNPITLSHFTLAFAKAIDLTASGPGGWYKPGNRSSTLARKSGAASTLKANVTGGYLSGEVVGSEASTLVGFTATDGIGANGAALAVNEPQGQCFTVTGPHGGTAVIGAGVNWIAGNLRADWYFYFSSGTNLRWLVETLEGFATPIVYDPNVHIPMVTGQLYQLAVHYPAGLPTHEELIFRAYADAVSATDTAKIGFACVTSINLGNG